MGYLGCLLARCVSVLKEGTPGCLPQADVSGYETVYGSWSWSWYLNY